MAHHRNSNSSNDQWSTYHPSHGFSNVQNFHPNAASNIQKNVFHHNYNSSKFSVNNVPQDVSQFQNTSSSCNSSTVRTPSETYSTETGKPINKSSYHQSYLNPRPQTNYLQRNQRFPFTSNQPHNVETKIQSPVPNSDLSSNIFSPSYHPPNQNLFNMSNFPSSQVIPINSNTSSNYTQPVENKIPSHILLSNQNISCPINLPPPPILPRLPMPVNSTLITENNSTNFNLKQFCMPNVPPHQSEQLSSRSVPTFPPITAGNFSLPPFVPSMIPTSCVQSSHSMYVLPSNLSVQSEKERELLNFVSKFYPKGKDKTIKKSNLTVVEFRSALKIGFSLLKMLSETKNNLVALLRSDEDQWNSHAKNALQLQQKLSEVCNMLCNSNNVKYIQNRLVNIKKKREYIKRRKLTMLSMKQEREKYRKELNQEIDKFLDNIKEKNLDIKRKMEMKKEADNILSEVRRKIHEGKRTIEKLKIFEKLRNARQASAMKKSLFIDPEHTKKFEEKVSALKKIMLKQLADYEAEERALKVMLETEQEEQLEHEALWRIRKTKTILQRKQKNIKECLFGDTDEPSPTDPIFLFYAHHTSANTNISSLVQIRHQWDVYLTSDGESIPQQWVVPVPPSSSIWEKFCSS